MSGPEITGGSPDRKAVDVPAAAGFALERIEQLVREILETGRTPEEVCAAEPDLLLRVGERWRQVEQVRDQFDALFPIELTPPELSAVSHARNSGLPQIPGYEVESILGRGGMGVVFRARHLRLNRTVALKMMLAGEFAGPRERERFEQEAEAVARLRHPNIVQVFDVGDVDGRPFFTMEFLEGGSLAQALDGTPCPPRQAAALVMNLASAVESAHQAGIVHRDLKPGNVLLTSDRSPKIGDFGLARRLEADVPPTQTGGAVGTPGYMAPEQVRGSGQGTCPPVDIHALGAILYELLTGTPPFRADSPSATLQRVLNEDAIPPSRHNSRIPRDLEVICLTCLEKEPQRRYASAGALEEDLRRFLAGEAIQARADGPIQIWIRRIRRRPILSGAIIGSLAIAAIGWRLLEDRAATRRQIASERLAIEEAARDDERQMSLALKNANWDKARAALERATARLGDRGPSQLQERLRLAEKNLALVSRLESIRLDRAGSVHGVLRFAEADEEYAEAFRTAGLGSHPDPVTTVAERVKQSDVSAALLGALDDWAAHPGVTGRGDWVLSVARLADPDASGWTAQVRDPQAWDDPQRLRALSNAAPIERVPVALAVAVAERLDAKGEDPVPFLRAIHRNRPADFWVNSSLGSMLAKQGNYLDALRYYQAAQAIRPDVSLVYNKLGIALANLNRPVEAVEHYQQAIEHDPASGPAHFNLILSLLALGRHEEVLARIPEAITLNSDAAILHSAWGDSLEATGRRDEAVEQYRKAVAGDPRLEGSQLSLRTLLFKMRKFNEAQETWSRYLAAAAPASQLEWDGYAELSLDLGREADYRWACRELLTRFGNDPDPRAAERIGRACLLLPVGGTPQADADRTVEHAVALIDRALADPEKRAPVWTKPYFLFAKGLAELRKGHAESAIRILEGEAAAVLGPAPQLVVALAEHSLGNNEKARKAFIAARTDFDWESFDPESRETWIYRILRREAEAALGP